MNLLMKMQLASLLLASAASSACAGTDQTTPPPQAPSSPPMETTGAPVSGTTSSSSLTANPTDTSNTGLGVQARTSSLTSASTAPSGPATGDNAMLSDGQIAMIASDVDKGEIAAAKMALTHAKSAKVRKFAQHMITAHTSVEQKLQAVLKAESITTADSSISQQLVTDGQSQADALRTNNGADFDRGYIAAQIAAHQAVLTLLDEKLLPSVKDAQLKAGLTETRLKVVDHIKMAQDVQSSLSP